MKNIQDVFVENVRRLREIRGMTQEQVAEKADIPLSSYRGLENKQQFPRVDKIEALAKVFGVSSAELFFVPNAIKGITTPARALELLSEHPQTDWLEVLELATDHLRQGIRVGPIIARKKEFKEFVDILNTLDEDDLDSTMKLLNSAIQDIGFRTKKI